MAQIDKGLARWHERNEFNDSMTAVKAIKEGWRIVGIYQHNQWTVKLIVLHSPDDKFIRIPLATYEQVERDEGRIVCLKGDTL